MIASGNRAAIAAINVAGYTGVLAVALPPLAFALQPSDDQVKQVIIRQSVAAYNATGHPCACPYQTDRAGHSCGRRSAYSRPGGAATLCYPQDVTPGMVSDWRRTHI
jgi:hypothetical protein